MALRDLKKGDKLYAVYNMFGHLYCESIYECTVKKVITNDFVTKIYIDCDTHSVGKKAVGYYLGDCAVSEHYFFTTHDHRLKYNFRMEQGYEQYLKIINSVERITQLIKERT